MIEVSVYVSAADFANNKRTFCERFNYVGVSVPYNSINGFLFHQVLLIHQQKLQ